MKRINVFVRQPFTQSGGEEQRIIQSAMDVLSQCRSVFDLNFLTPLRAETSATFKKRFEEIEKRPFTPENFRNYRLKLIHQADAFVFIKTGLSESGSFEIAYNIFKGNKAPLFFAVWEKTPIKTKLLRDLDNLCLVQYKSFKHVDELKEPICNYFKDIAHAI